MRMRKSELVISASLAIAVLAIALAFEHDWAPAGLKKVASSAEKFMLGSTGLISSGFPEIPGFNRIQTYTLNRNYRAALFRSNSATLGFAPGRFVIYNRFGQSVFTLNTLEGARDPWTALYDFTGRHGLPARNGHSRTVYLRDLTGDGAPDAIVGSYSGGNRCCTTLDVLEADSDSLKTIGHIEGLSGWPFESVEIRKLSRSGGWQLVTHHPHVTSCGSRDDAADVIRIYAYIDGRYEDQTPQFEDYLQGVLQQNMAKWSREKELSLGLLQTLAAQWGEMGQPDRAKKFFQDNLPRFEPEMKQNKIDTGACTNDLNALVDRLAKQGS